MIKKIVSLFKGSSAEIPSEEKEESTPELETESIEVPDPEPLPDVIEVPWSECGRVKNIEIALQKIHEDYKEFLYKNKLTEKKTFHLIDTFEEASDNAIKELKEAYNITEDGSYSFVLPEGTGRSGFFKKNKTNK